MSEPTIRETDCGRARSTLHGLLDGDAVEPRVERAYREHLAVCSSCRETDRDLRMIQGELKELPLQALPDTALERVWRRTVRAEAARPTRRRFAGLDWRAVAAAAVLAAVLLGLQSIVKPEPSEAELNQAAVEARMALLLTARALRHSERTVMREVLAKEVSPALERAPIPANPARRARDGS